MKFMVNGAVDVNRAVYRVPLLRWREVVGIGVDMGIWGYISVEIEMKIKMWRARAQ